MSGFKLMTHVDCGFLGECQPCKVSYYVKDILADDLNAEIETIEVEVNMYVVPPGYDYGSYKDVWIDFQLGMVGDLSKLQAEVDEHALDERDKAQSELDAEDYYRATNTDRHAPRG